MHKAEKQRADPPKVRLRRKTPRSISAVRSVQLSAHDQLDAMETEDRIGNVPRNPATPV